MWIKTIMMLIVASLLLGCQQEAPTAVPDQPQEDPVVTTPVEPAEPGPTCSDGLQNQGETGVDCGGPCRACPTCDDGRLNQGEEKIDCGGPCDPCPVPKDNDPIVEELIARHSKIDGGYSYDYSHTDDSLANQPGTVDRISVLEDRIKVNYFVMQEHEGYDFNYLYLDKDAEEAYLYCLDVMCKEMNGTAKSVSFMEFNLETPFEVLDNLIDADYVTDHNFNSKESVVLSEETDDYSKKLYVWEFYGMPQQVEVEYPDSKVVHRYENYLFNKVNEEDVTLPSWAVMV